MLLSSKQNSRTKEPYVKGFCRIVHLLPNGKHKKKKMIFQLKQDEGMMVEETNLKVFIRKYYKKLFRAPAPSHSSLLEESSVDIP
jgi:hypothetical protein